MTGKTPQSVPRKKPEHLVQQMRLSQSVAAVGGVFTLAFLILMIINGYRHYVIGAREEALLTLQKQQLLQHPEDDALLVRIRIRDQDIRSDKLQQLDFTAMASLMLLISASVTVGGIKWYIHLKGIDPLPKGDKREPIRQRRLGISRLALGMVAFFLATMAYSLGHRVPSEWVSLTETGNIPSDVSDYATPEELARNWHRFRGFAGAGVTSLTDIPTQWDGASGSNICWKTPIPLPGHNSPVVWENRIFLSGATEKKREVYGIDAKTGAILWTGNVPTPPGAGAPEVMEETGLAASTLATDGVRVYAIFASGDLAAFDFSGNFLWHKNLGIPDSVYGYAASLEVWEDRVLVQYDQAYVNDGKSRLYAFDGSTGAVVWETKRPVANSWTSPFVGFADNGYRLITAGMPWVIAYDPKDGTPIWQAECLKGDVAPSPILAGDLVIVSEPNIRSIAIRTGGRGDVTKTHILWRNEDVGPEIVSPVSNGQQIFHLDSYGTLYALNAADGKLLYNHDFDEMVNASPSLVGDKLYVLAVNGTMFIGTPDERGFTRETESALGETCFASPAFMPGRIYIRGTEHLYCIGNETS